MRRAEEIQARRRVAASVGLTALLIASATACIFEKSTYQGGGRVDRGAEVRTAEPPASSSPTATATAEPTAPVTIDSGALDE